MSGSRHSPANKIRPLVSPCFIQPKVALEVVPGIVPCPDPNTRAFYDQLHPSTRFHAAIGLTGVLPSLRLAGLLPA
ncbi:hypothetical protein CHLRE_02g144007v5 [Chlamydomonas reinhardtii]|uniref:Uncharacterized protein n=1 Tax=Chlamydomonas reinhardtii TaxID=3055 RepID=A0A2K3E3W1_CHLRE|nr:uncharacterized protein CHLRE_02g144007v5 [Chlamydomonas reinhardtii]PNW87488.1 hypothetical protein CHLRE_02g144007v5 [Chlamydomonas reinhardtii]